MMLMTVSTLQWLHELDTATLLAVNGTHAPYWDTFMWFCSNRLMWVGMYLLIIYVLFRNYGWRVILSCLLAMGIVLLLTDAFISQLIRPTIGRMRPSNPYNAISPLIHIVDNHRGGRYGFPSTHASNAWGLVFFVTWLIRRRGLTLFLSFWALLQCYSRLYLGVHYPSDLLAGFLWGLFCATMIYWVFVRVSGHRQLTDFKYSDLPIWIGLLTMLILFIIPFFHQI